MSQPVSPVPPTRRRFSGDLALLAAYEGGSHVSFREIEGILNGRGLAALTLVLCLPFIQPIPLPGLSMVFGLAMMALGGRLVFKEQGTLPRLVSDRHIDTARLRRMAHGAQKVFRPVERFTRPRLSFFTFQPLRALIGASIILCGSALLLPLPPFILFSNALPAWAIILLCLGMMERDGVFVICGHILTVATWIYFAFWWEIVKVSVLNLFEMMGL